MEKIFKKLHICWTSIIITAIFIAFIASGYQLAHLVSQWLGLKPILVKIDVIDNAIPFLPIFAIPYFLSYVFWILTPLFAYNCDKKHFKNGLAGFLIASIIGILMLTFIPTYLDRVAEGLMDNDQGFLNKLCLFIYNSDGGKMGFNLFPSFHCINSVSCYLFVARRKEVPLWYRIFALIFTILICLATVFIKQHYIIDSIVGIPLAIIAFFVAKKLNLGRMFDKVIK